MYNFNYFIFIYYKKSNNFGTFIRFNNKNELLVRLEYYQFGIKRIDNTWKEFEDCGEEFKNINHNFSSDLDIFGVGSLFQWCNTTRTKFGRKALATILNLNNLPNRYEIIDNQEAIKELVELDHFIESRGRSQGLDKDELIQEVMEAAGIKIPEREKTSANKTMTTQKETTETQKETTETQKENKELEAPEMEDGGMSMG